MQERYETYSASLARMIMPGVLVAATGVGAGNILTAGLGGSAVSLGILWRLLPALR